MSAVEAVTNVVVGFALAFLTQLLAFPLFGLQVSVTDNVLISVIFTAVSILRSFMLRRLFEANRIRKQIKANASNPAQSFVVKREAPLERS
jgi:hypothetical protein